VTSGGPSVVHRTHDQAELSRILMRSCLTFPLQTGGRPSPAGLIDRYVEAQFGNRQTVIGYHPIPMTETVALNIRYYYYGLENVDR